MNPVTAPKRRADALLPARQRDVIAAMNATQGPVWNGRLEAGFLRAARRTPDAPAIVSADCTLTYAQAARRVVSVAARIRAAGCGPGSRVAVVADSGWEGVIAVLASVCAGAAYVPIHGEVPAERLAWALHDADVGLVLTERDVAARHAWPAGLPTICLDELDDANPRDEIETFADRDAIDDVAYVIYTSGSTGRPKGLVMSHRAAVNTVQAVIERWDIGARDRVLGLSSLSFDLSVFDVFGTLGVGATLVLPEPAASRDPNRWWEIAGRTGVTIWNSVPALLDAVVDYVNTVHPAGPGLSTLRLAMLSGDWIPVRLPDAVRTLAPTCAIVSLGGATEAGIWSVAYPIDRVDPAWTSIPYGRPLTNQRAYVLNSNGDLCPLWVPGELYIGGASLGRGYWNDDARTAASFIEHEALGERLYRTGDQARIDADGNLQLLGRVDDQLKLHGHRIEPSEIESALLQHPGVHAAVVVLLQQGGARLAACVVPATGSQPAAEDLRAHLAAVLPRAFVPVAYRLVDALPLTANGKIDRHAVVRMDFNVAAPVESAGTPATAAVADLIATVLHIGHPDPHVRLLDVGADSITLIQIANRLEARFGRRPDITFLFQNPTVAELTAAVMAEEQRA
jgi:amino acid adenylation domain-containing protein